jgi:DNA modification methylase
MKPYFQDDAVQIYLGDCREIVPTLGRFDLLCADPPYGIDADNRKKIMSRGKLAAATDYGESDWDSKPVDDALLQLCLDACDKHVIWGGNYYILRPPCKGPLVWDKLNTGDFADGEMAWNTLGCAMRIFKFMWNGMLRAGESRGVKRVHPTQKPVELMRWCITLAGDVQTILDPFAGVCTTGRAAKDLGKKCVCIEKCEAYCEIGARRMAQQVFDFNG